MIPTTAHFGADIPKLGFGTWKLEGQTATDCTRLAIETGYRHIDTAQVYENEAEVGQGISESGVARDDLFVTTKIWRDQFRDGDLQRATETSLDKLKLDHVDLLLLHWPVFEVPLEETLGALNEVKSKGLTRHIGVSNFTVELFRKAMDLSAAPLVTNQVEYHPFINQNALLRALRDAGSALTAYSPLARGDAFDNDTLARVAEAHGKSPAQVTLRWFVQQPDVIAIPKSATPDHIRSNIEITDFELTDKEMTAITALNAQHMRIIDPSWAPDWDAAA